MELSFEDAQHLLIERLNALPEIKAYVENPAFLEKIKNILVAEGFAAEIAEIVKQELIYILTLYVPIEDLAKNLVESTGIKYSHAERLSMIFEATLLAPFLQDLIIFSRNAQDREKNTTQPLPTQTPLDEPKIYEPAPVLRAGYAAGSPEAQKPLTREDILRALN